MIVGFVGGIQQIPANRLSPAALALAKQLPQTTDPCGRTTTAMTSVTVEQYHLLDDLTVANGRSECRSSEEPSGAADVVEMNLTVAAWPRPGVE